MLSVLLGFLAFRKAAVIFLFVVDHDKSRESALMSMIGEFLVGGTDRIYVVCESFYLGAVGQHDRVWTMTVDLQNYPEAVSSQVDGCCTKIQKDLEAQGGGDFSLSVYLLAHGDASGIAIPNIGGRVEWKWEEVFKLAKVRGATSVTYFIDSCSSGAAIEFVQKDPDLKDKTAVVAACDKDQCAHGCDTGTVLTIVVQHQLDGLRKGTEEPANAKDVVSKFAQKVLVSEGDKQHPREYIDTKVYVPDGWKRRDATDLPFWNGLGNQEDDFDIIFTQDGRLHHRRHHHCRRHHCRRHHCRRHHCRRHHCRRHSSSRLVCHYN